MADRSDVDRQAQGSQLPNTIRATLSMETWPQDYGAALQLSFHSHHRAPPDTQRPFRATPWVPAERLEHVRVSLTAVHIVLSHR